MCPPDGNIKARAAGMSIKELKAFLREHQVPHEDCLEKQDLVRRVEETLNKQQHAGHSSQATKADEKGAEKHDIATVRSIAVGPLACNMTIIMDKQSKHAVLVDPGGDADKIISLIKDMGASVKQIVVTHAHFDHILAAEEVKKATGASVYLHEADLPLWKMLPMQCAMLGMPPPSKPVAEPGERLVHQQKLPVLDGVVLHTPGHSPGSCSFHFPSIKLLCSGDTLFQGSVGRTDLPGGDFKTLTRSIQERIYTLPTDTRIIPGHGAETTVGHERLHNAIIRSAV